MKLSDFGINCFGVGAILVLLSVVGPKLDEIQTTAEAIESSAKAQAKQERFEQAARAVCGENAAWQDIGGGAIQCFTHRGHKTLTARIDQ